MQTVYKYPLQFSPHQKIVGPITQVLTVQIQNGIPCVWASVDTNLPELEGEVFMCGTGTDDGLALDSLIYIGTTQVQGFVFHWFYKEGQYL